MNLVYTERPCLCPLASHVHGTRQAYLRDKCRCKPCRAGNAEHARIHRRRVAQRRWNGGGVWVDSCGTRRRLQALAADGWSIRALAPHFGATHQSVTSLKNKLSDRCLESTAAHVRRVYETLWFQTPTGNAIERTRRWAERAGHVESWRWEGVDIDDPAAQPHAFEVAARKLDIDEIAVERAMAGDPPAGLTKRERAEAIQRLTDRGLSADEICALMRLNNPRLVTRDRAAVRARAA